MAASEQAPPQTPRRHRRWPWLIGVPLALLLVLAGAVVGLWHSDAGLRWALARVPGLQADGVEGRPTGGAYRIARLQWQGGGTTVTLRDLAWQDARWRWRPHPGAWVGLTLVRPAAAEVEVRTTPQPEPDPPMQPPEHLRLPLALAVEDLRLGRVQVNDLPAISGVAADLALGADAGALHRLQRLALQVQGLQLLASAQVGAGGELPLQAALAVATADGARLPWRLTADAGGPLRQPRLAGRLDAGPAGQAGLEAVLAPFAPWPLVFADLRPQALDLSVLAPGLPATRLDGQARVDGGADGQALRVTADVTNARPGAWDAARLPVRRLQATLAGRPTDPLALTLERLIADLGGDAAAGRLTGDGRLDAGTLDLRLALDGVQPARLHGAAPPMTLSGPVTLRLAGLPTGPTPSPPAPLDAAVGVDLQGRLARRGAPPLRLTTQATLQRAADGRLAFDLPSLQAQAGDASAQAQAAGRQDGNGRWAVSTEGRLRRLDPADWLPLPASRQPSSLTGDWSADVVVAPDAGGLAGVQGRARLRLDEGSRLAGVPLSADARLTSAADRAVGVDGWLQAAGNRLSADGRTTAGEAGLGQWRIALQAPRLDALAPLLALAPGSADWRPTGGSATGQATLAGQWPRLRTEGRIELDALRLPGLAADRLQAQWRFGGLVADAPLGLQLEAAGLAQGERRLQRLQARLDGTLSAHRLSLQADSPLQPPAWAGAAPGGSRLVLEANGRWQPESSGSRWQGTLQQLRAAPRQGGGTPWLQAQDLGLDTRLDAAGRPLQASLAPGRLTVLNAALRWTTARWQAAQGGRPQQARLQAELEPLTVAPLLAALQPQFGWRGDLAIGGRADITLAETLNADVQLSRRSGDLGLRVDGRPLDFGLQALLVTARADGGRWQLAQTLASDRLARIEGRQTLTGAPGDLAPTGDARLDGRLQLDLPALAAFSPWVPAGWRVDGRLAADVGLGGTLASPDLRGEVSGRELAVRNLFQGVNLRDGRLLVRLDGQRVQVAEGVFRSEGDGLLRLDGEAALSTQPQGRLRVVAERFRALDRVDRRVTVSGSATVALAQQLSVDGRFRLDEGRIDISQSDAPALDDDIVVLNREGTVAPKGPGGSAPPGLALRVAVDLGQQLLLTGRGLDARLGGELDVTTPNGTLAVNGVVRILEGTYTAYGQNLSVARGNVVFTGDAANPRLDIFAIRPDIDQRVGITVSGNAVNPRVRLTSEPELPEIDKLTWLVLGRAPEGLGRADTALLQRAALALVAGDKGGKGGGVAEKVGLDKLTLRGGNAAEGGGAVIGLGKQLSKRLFFGYEHALASAGGYWQIVYRAAGRLTLRARAGLDNAIDAVWTWRWE